MCQLVHGVIERAWWQGGDRLRLWRQTEQNTLKCSQPALGLLPAYDHGVFLTFSEPGFPDLLDRKLLGLVSYNRDSKTRLCTFNDLSQHLCNIR